MAPPIGGCRTAASPDDAEIRCRFARRLRDRALLLWTAGWVVVALVAIARIAQRAHWPADALGGAALGLAFASAAFWWHEAHAREEA